MALDKNDFKFSLNPSWSHCEWDYRIVETKKNRFFAELLVLDEYDDYLMQWKVYETSPKFNMYLIIGMKKKFNG